TSVLRAGQTVAVRVASFTAAGSSTPASVSADFVGLRFSRVTAGVASSSPPNVFFINNLPPFFGVRATPGAAQPGCLPGHRSNQFRRRPRLLQLHHGPDRLDPRALFRRNFSHAFHRRQSSHPLIFSASAKGNGQAHLELARFTFTSETRAEIYAAGPPPTVVPAGSGVAGATPAVAMLEGG